jgi:hypothetical protein
VYFRLRELPADLPAQPAGRPPPCIVDVRYLNADADAAAAFASWLKSRATPRTPVFVLANADTSRPLLAALAQHERGAGIAVVGIERGMFRPDVAVKASAEDERRAFLALEQGTPIATLLTDNPNKVRNDEASLSPDRSAQPTAQPTDGSRTEKRDAPPIDATLQRAVHLHRALVALKRI